MGSAHTVARNRARTLRFSRTLLDAESALVAHSSTPSEDEPRPSTVPDAPAAPPQQQQQQQQPRRPSTHMNKAARPVASHRGRGGAGGGSGPGGRGPGGGPDGVGLAPEVQQLAGHSIYVGLMGTVAVLGASTAHVDLWGMFDWAATQDLALALALIVPLQVANVVLLGPDYSDWRLSNHKPLATPHTLRATQPEPLGAAPSQPPAPPDAGAPAAPAASAGAGGVVPANLWGRAGSPAPSSSSRSSIIAPRTAVAAAVAAPLPPALRTLRDAAHLAQSNYVASNPTARLGPAAELAVVVADSLAGEMLFRGLLLTCLAAWLRDRLADAGWPDVVELPMALQTLAHGSAAAAEWELGGESGAAAAKAAVASLEDVSLWAAGGGVLALLALLSVRRTLRQVRKAAMVVDIHDRIAATRRAQQHQQQERHRQLQPRDPSSSALPDGPGAPQAARGAGAQPTSTSDTVQDSLTSTGSPSLQPPLPPPAQAASTSLAGPAPPPPMPLPPLPQPPSPASTGGDVLLPPPPQPAAMASRPGAAAGSSPPSGEPLGCGPGGALPPPEPTGMAGSSLPPHPGTARWPRSPTPPASQSAAGADPHELPGSSGAGGAGEAGGRPSLHGLLALVGGGLGGGPSGWPAGGAGYDAVAWAAALQCSRDLLQGGTLTLAFAATGGNLAACMAASLANQVVFSVLQRWGAERSRQRSAALAAELKEINARLRSISSSAPKPQAPAGSTAAQSPAAQVPASSPSPSSSASDASGSSSASDAPGGSGTPASMAVVGSGAARAELPAAGLARTLGLLDMLVPEPPASKAAPAQRGSDSGAPQERGNQSSSRS